MLICSERGILSNGTSLFEMTMEVVQVAGLVVVILSSPSTTSVDIYLRFLVKHSKGIFQPHLKIFIIRLCSRSHCKIINKLFIRQPTIFPTCNKLVVELESFYKVCIDVIFRSFVVKDFWMTSRIKAMLNIFEIDEASVLSVHSRVKLIYQLSSIIIHLTK